MNKRLTIGSIILSGLVLALSLFVTPFFSSASAAAGQYIRLVGITYQNARAVVFTFDFSGSFDSFEGSVIVNGKTAALTCDVVSETGSVHHGNQAGTVNCTADGIGEKFVGFTANTILNGFEARGLIKRAQYCAPVFDYVNSSNFSIQPTWNQIGIQCQSEPISWGQELYYYNPDYSASFYYYYYNNGNEATCTNPPLLGSGFYYDECSF